MKRIKGEICKKISGDKAVMQVDSPNRLGKQSLLIKKTLRE